MMGRKVLAAKSGRAACSCAAAGGAGCSVSVFNAEKQSSREAKSFLTGLTGLREASVNPAKTKPSGVAWIGDIPEGWEVSRLKNLALDEGSLFLDGDWINSPDITSEGVRYFTTGNIGQGKFKEQGNSFISRETFERLNCLEVHGGDLIVARLNEPIGRACIIPKIYKACIVAVDCVVFRPDRNCFKKYLVYVMSTDQWAELGSLLARGTTMPRISRTQLGNMLLPLPPLSEQRAIAAYLDDKCGAIDAAVAEAKKGIEEYKAWKKSLIFEVVTGKRRVGFFNAESQSRRVAEKMKSSGIPWIGDVPVGWEVCKTLHSLCMPITDGPHTTPELFDDGIPFVSAEAVSCGNGSIDFNHVRGFISEAFYNECCRKYIPQRDDIYMIKSGATTGRVAIVDTDRIFTIWSPLAVFRCNLKRAKPRYVFYYLQSSAYQGQVELAWSFGTQQNIGMRALEELKMVLPPLTEQRAIADYLDDKCAVIDAMVAEKEALIADLEAYKKSLIYEAVTGKREVRIGGYCDCKK